MWEIKVWQLLQILTIWNEKANNLDQPILVLIKLLISTCTQLYIDVDCKVVGAPVAQGGIGHRAQKIVKSQKISKS